MAQPRGARRKRKLEELSLDEFLDGGFALAGGGGARPESAERAPRAPPPAGSEAVQHRAQLDALRERDPDFYAYLQQTDAELLRFGEGGEAGGGGDSGGSAPGSASDEEPPVAAPAAGAGGGPAPAQPARDAPEGARGAARRPAGTARAPPLPPPPLSRPPTRAGKGGAVVTAALIDRWCQDARATCSYRAMRNLLRVRPPGAARRAGGARRTGGGRRAARARRPTALRATTASRRRTWTRRCASRAWPRWTAWSSSCWTRCGRARGRAGRRRRARAAPALSAAAPAQADGILRGMLGLDRDAQLRSSDVTQSPRCAPRRRAAARLPRRRRRRN